MTEVERVGKLLRESIRSARADGYRIINNRCKNFEGEPLGCCAVGSMIRDEPHGHHIYAEISKRLGIGYQFVIAIASGFDGSKQIRHDDVWMNLGTMLRYEVRNGLL